MAINTHRRLIVAMTTALTLVSGCTNVVPETWDLEKFYSIFPESWQPMELYSIFPGNWHPQQPSPHPSARHGSAMAQIDAGTILLYGGVSDGGPTDETWIYRYSTDEWEQQSPETSPPNASGAAMAYLTDELVVLYSPYENNPACQGTWLYNLSLKTWYNVVIANEECPGVTKGFAMAHLSDRKVLLSGGVRNDETLDETWILTIDEFVAEGSAIGKWVESAPMPQPRRGHDTAFIDDGEVLLFGGEGGVSLALTEDTFLFTHDAASSGSWSTVEVNIDRPQPPARSGHGMAFVGDGKVLLYGGRGPNEDVLQDTWLFFRQINSWIRDYPPQNLDQQPKPVWGFGIATMGLTGGLPGWSLHHYIDYYPVVLFGGGGGGTSYSETWTYYLYP
jgi:hypothetical protein